MRFSISLLLCLWVMDHNSDARAANPSKVLPNSVHDSMFVRINLRNYLFDDFSFTLRGQRGLRKVDNDVDRLTDQRKDHVHLAKE